MTLELNLRFPTPEQVIVRLIEDDDHDESESLPFRGPLAVSDQQDLHWYLEVYAAQYVTDVDDERAQRIAARLPEWGAALLAAVLGHDIKARRLFDRFLERREPGRLLTVSSDHPAVLAQPWELLRDPAGTYLVHETPRISVRRRLLPEIGDEQAPLQVKPKDRLRLLFVVSRPKEAGFIDPRADAMAVLDALDAKAPGRVEVEFLRPAIFRKLVERLENAALPPVDILHFDGHGMFDTGENTGYLSFERDGAGKAPIDAELLGERLHGKGLGLMVLSACQSAAVGGEDPLGSIAARLTHAGIPTVLAMTHSVLVATTRALFEAFYERIGQGKAVTEALDEARQALFQQRARGERQRGSTRITLELQDWFLSALYQAGQNTPLLTAQAESAVAPVRRNNLPTLQEAGFFGRSRELWEIEREFVKGTRRLAITSFGGQGKSYLAAEAGRWLQRTGMFRRVCWISYDAFQGIDAVEFAISVLATVVEKNLPDVQSATQALQTEPVLLILDNLESLETQPLRELLGVAKEWSEAGESRVLITTRMANLEYPDYCYLPLKGLDQEDALDYFQALAKLPPEPKLPLPERETLLDLFEQVDFHPLSIGLLAQQLKFRQIAELGERLETLLLETPDNPLLASLNLSLERLTPEARQRLPRLGVFQGGAFESRLLEITELAKSDWAGLQQELATTGLIQIEPIPGINPPFLRFHPTLAPVLWSRLPPEEQATLSARHRERYYAVSGTLYQEDQRHPHKARAIAQRELPNLLHAVGGALTAREDEAVEFVEYVNHFLDSFGLHRDRVALIQRAEAVAGAVGSHNWFLARTNRGEQLRSAGRHREAQAVFEEILQGLGTAPSYERCLTLNRLGRCFRGQGQLKLTETHYRQALAVAQQLEASPGVRRQISALQTDLADVLTDKGDYVGARAAYETGLAIAEELSDLRQVAVVNGQLGTLALMQNDLPEAERRYQGALAIFQRLGELAHEAVAWHQLGMVYSEARQWDAAERAYREAARIRESLGNLAGAAGTWNNLAVLTKSTGKPADAEGWYRKALAGSKTVGDQVGVCRALNNLADLLRNDPKRLAEARQCAEQTLAIQQTLDPAAAEIWKTYQLLAEIATQEGDAEQVRSYRRREREMYAGFAGAWYELRRRAPFIQAVVVVAAADPTQRDTLEAEWAGMIKRGWGSLVVAICRIWDGERDKETICEGLNHVEWLIVHAILREIAEPGSLERLLSESEEG
ncbi:MAG: tetratricopeptide repeat protein [Candidatus Competibacteraceae bacterium]